MQKLAISYSDYDVLCKNAATIEYELSRLPTKEEIDLLTSFQTGYFLSMLTWLVENEKGIPDTAEAKEIREYLLDRMDEGVSDFMIFSKEPFHTDGKKIKLDADDYLEMVHIAKKIDFIAITELPTEEQIQEIFLPGIVYNLGFLLTLLFKRSAKKSTLRYKYLRNILDSHFELFIEQKRFQMTEKSYHSFCDTITKCSFKREKWWPTEKEIKNIIIPNLDSCYDFIIWILNTGDAPSTPEEKKAAKLLKEIIRENTDLSEKGDVKWL